MSVVALVIAPSLKNTADINNSMELTNTEQEAVIYEKVESEEIVIYSSASDFNINKSNNVTQLTNLVISNDMFCQSGGSACNQFASSCTDPLVFTPNSSVAVSRIDAYSYQIDGVIKFSSTNQSEAIVYYDVINDEALTGQIVFNDMTLKFKGKK